MLGAFCVQTALAAIAGERSSICLGAMTPAERLAFMAFVVAFNRWRTSSGWTWN